MEEKRPPRAQAPIWHWLPKSQKEEFRRLLPAEWQPPLLNEPVKDVIGGEDLARMMRRKPQGDYAAYISGRKGKLHG